MTDEHLQAFLKLALTKYSADFQQMVDEMQAHIASGRQSIGKCLRNRLFLVVS
jgi:hypothetical protein